MALKILNLSWIYEGTYTYRASYFLGYFFLAKKNFFWRKIFHKLRVVHNIFFFLLLQAKDEMNSSHFPNHDSLIMHILVMLESDQKNINLTSFDNLILFLHVFTELLFASFFTSFLDARQLLLVLLGILRTCVGISWKKYCKRKKKMWKKWKKIRKKGQKKERKKDMIKRLDKRCGFFQIRLWCWKTSFSLILI